MLAVEVVVVPCFLGVCGFSRAALDTLGGTGTGTDTGTGAGPGTTADSRRDPGSGELAVDTGASSTVDRALGFPADGGVCKASAAVDRDREARDGSWPKCVVLERCEGKVESILVGNFQRSQGKVHVPSSPVLGRHRGSNVQCPMSLPDLPVLVQSISPVWFNCCGLSPLRHPAQGFVCQGQ